MDYGKALKFIFEDKDWIGVILIGGALGLLSLLFFWTLIIPILIGALLYGYMMQLIRDVRNQPDAGLPAWTDWGKKLADGFKLLIVQFIWGVPFLLFFIPMAFMLVLADAYPNSEALAALAGVSVMGAIFLAVIYGVILIFLMPAITINLAVKENLSAGLEMETIFGITKAHFVDILIILILVYGVSYIAGWIGFLLLFIGIFFTNFWVLLVQGHLYGQLARLALPVVDPANTPLPVPAAPQPEPATD